MVTRGLSDYVSRGWDAARRAKDDYWAARVERLGPAEGLRIAEELRAQVRRLHPQWPTQSDRRADLLAHSRVADLLRRASPARGR